METGLKSRKERKRALSHLMKNFPKTSKLCRITRCPFFRKEKYSGYLKYAFKSRKRKNCFNSDGGFFKTHQRKSKWEKGRRSSILSTLSQSCSTVNCVHADVYINHTHRMSIMKVFK